MSAFDRSARLQLELPDILTDIAAPRVPDYVDDILAQTAVTRQRPRWTFIERWLPMGVIARRMVLFPRVPWRTLVAVALLIALLAAALLIVGSQHKLPSPFGPARNGMITYGSNGDVWARETIDGPARLLVGGSTDDFASGFTRSGTQLVFLRRTSGTAGSPDEQVRVVISNLDGSNPRVVTSDLKAPDWFDWSPDDSHLVIQANDGATPLLYVLDPVTGKSDAIDTGKVFTLMTTPNFLGPSGTEITFRGRMITDHGVFSGIFAVHPDGSGLHALTPTDDRNDSNYQFPQTSPDGKWLNYTKWDSTKKQNRIHLVNLTTGEDRRLELTSADSDQGYATFSPDSKLMTFVAYLNGRDQVMVAPVDGSANAVGMGPSYPIVDGQYLTGLFSPDGTSMIVNDPASAEGRIIDVKTGGMGTILAWSSGDTSGWQRLAP
jgi:Tol biopolymer transport system component